MWRNLYFQVILAVAAGIALGIAAPETAQAMKPLGDAFIKLIKMLIAPLIFCTIVSGIAGMRSMKNAGRVGLKALIYFEALTTVALFIGLFVVNTYQPGAGMHVDPAALDANALAAYTGKASENKSLVDFLLHMIPDTMVGAFAQADILQVLMVAFLVGGGLVASGNRGYQITQLIQQLSDLLFKIIAFVVALAPIGAFGAMAFTVGKYGVATLGPMLHLMLAFYITCIAFIFILLAGVVRLMGLRLLPLLKYLKSELLIVFGTSSSEPALPGLMEKMVALGCPRAVVGMVVPAGYSFNLDGTCIYLTMGAMFVAQALHVPLTFGEQLLMLSVLLLTSKGAAGVTGSGFVVLAASLATVGHVPVAGLALILGIDRFMSQARALTNFIGNAVATIVVSRWEGALDVAAARKALNINQ